MSKIGGKFAGLILVVCIILTAAACDKQEKNEFFEVDGCLVIKNEDTEINYIQNYGEVPDELSNIVSNDVLDSVVAGDDCYFKYAVSGLDISVEKYGLNFQKQLDFRIKSVGSIRAIIALSDGGMLCSMGSGEYQNNSVWFKAESAILKYDRRGDLEWKCELDGYSDSAADYLYEIDGGYCAVGHTETLATKNEGIYSPDDVCMIVLDRSGNITGKKFYGGSDFDSLSSCWQVDGGYELLVSTQSTDGTFKASSDGSPVKIRVKLDENFDVLSFENTGFTDCKFIGRLDGQAVYCVTEFVNEGDSRYYESRIRLSDGRELPNTQNCNSKILIDCEEYYLLMYSHTAGECEYQMAYMSGSLYYTQNVYEAYDKSGKLLWRGCVDSNSREQMEFIEKCREIDKTR